MGRWTTGTHRIKKGSIGDLDHVDAERDEDGDVIDEGAQAMLDSAIKAVGQLVNSGALGAGVVEVTANGYAAKGGKNAGERPTSWLTISVAAVDPKTDAPRTWVAPTEAQQAAADELAGAPAEQVVDS